jgi:hypothetical protein
MPAASAGVRVWPHVGLAIQDWPDLVRHFEREYGPSVSVASIAPDSIRLVVSHLDDPDGTSSRPQISRGSHKGTTWSATLGDPQESPIQIGLSFRGPFARSLLQSQVIEPAIAVAMPDGAALVPSAGIVTGDTSVLLAGASRSGKSTLAMRAWGDGRRLLGDDRVVVTRHGMVRTFPRRLRLYPDLSATAPRAFERLPRGTRRSLRMASVVRRLTAGWVGLPVLTSWQPFLARREESARLRRMVVVARDAGASEVSRIDGFDGVLERLGAVIREDLASVARHDPSWTEAAAHSESRILDVVRAAAIATGASGSVVIVPRRWDAETALAAVEPELGLEA